MGNSNNVHMTTHAISVHPHVHGELYLEVLDRAARIGSSPRAWGTPRDDDNPDSCSRFIPTCMGNSWEFAAAFGTGLVHPHVHGELKDWIPFNWRFCLRFIPTCMGNS